MHARSVDKLERNRGGVDGASGRCDKSVCSRVEAWGRSPTHVNAIGWSTLVGKEALMTGTRS